MSEEYGGDIISISDDEGNNYNLEHLDTIEMDGTYYLAFLPADIDENDDNYGFVILKSEHGDDGEDYLSIPDDDEEEKVYNIFIQRLFSDEDDSE